MIGGGRGVGEKERKKGKGRGEGGSSVTYYMGGGEKILELLIGLFVFGSHYV